MLTDIGSCPTAFVSESANSVLILTGKELVRVKNTGEIQRLLPIKYRFLYPNSMVIGPTGIIHIGMRHFVTRLTPTGNTYKEEWFVPAKCTQFSVKGLDCVC